MPELPREREATVAHHQFIAFTERYLLYDVPFAAPLGDAPIPTGEGAAGALLYLPSATETAILDAIPASRERRPHPVFRLP